jgi:hypothetical protein
MSEPLPVTLSSTLESFSGAWQRTLLYEPHDAVVPHEQSAVQVFWLQSPCGLFVDLRQPTGALDLGAATFKSFAGMGSVEFDSLSQQCRFTWSRLVDFRPPGNPDVGNMIWLGPNLLQEDGILPGDDYREIWSRVSPASHSTIGVHLRCDDDPGARGVLVIIDSYVAFATQRTRSACLAAVAFFATATSGAPPPEVTAWLDGFISVLAKDGVVVLCSQPGLVGQPISTAASRLQGWRAVSAPGYSSVGPAECLLVNEALGTPLFASPTSAPATGAV